MGLLEFKRILKWKGILRILVLLDFKGILRVLEWKGILGILRILGFWEFVRILDLSHIFWELIVGILSEELFVDEVDVQIYQFLGLLGEIGF